MPRLDKHYPKQLFEGLKRRRARPKGLPPRPIIESLPVIDIRHLAPYPDNWFRRLAFPNIGFHIPALRHLTFSRAKCEIVLTSGKRQSIPLAWQVISGARRFRARYQRPIFVCGCGRRALKVFLHRGEFTCKRCTGGVYACQVASGKAARSRLQAKRLQTYLVGYPVENERVPDKPMWWHLESYDRLVSKLAMLQARTRKPRGGRRSRRITERMIWPLWEYRISV